MHYELLVTITGFQIKHSVACYPFLQKAPKPLNPNSVSVQSKVMMLRYSLENSSVSHPQPNLHYSTVGLPLHPRGCLLRACEAQWTEFQWADSFFCPSVCPSVRPSVCTYRVHTYFTVTIWYKLKCWDASFLPSSFSTSLHPSFTFNALCFPCSAFVPLSPSLSLHGLFTFFCHP